MKEIGGYFGLEQFDGSEYHDSLIGVNSGRNALLYIMKARGYRKLYIPRFLCDSVAELCCREGFSYEEYSIDEHFLPQFKYNPSTDEALYIVNFYGQIPDAYVMKRKQLGNVIFDNVQDFFRKPIAGVDTVYSCRKFFGVPDGGYVSCNAPKLSLETDCSRERMTHILGRLEVSGSAFYGEFKKNDELFYELPLMEMSVLTRNILRGVDYDAVRRARNENYAYLHASLGVENRLSLTAPDGPYAYPFYCQNGKEIRKKLAAEKIYVATLWPNVLSYDGTLEKDYAENILPLPCDQRYDKREMVYIVDMLRKFID